MKLRLRLTAAAATVAVATIGALQWINWNQRRDEGAERLIASVERLLANPDERARCEAAPATWGPPPGWPPPMQRIARPRPGPNGVEVRRRHRPRWIRSSIRSSCSPSTRSFARCVRTHRCSIASWCASSIGPARWRCRPDG